MGGGGVVVAAAALLLLLQFRCCCLCPGVEGSVSHVKPAACFSSNTVVVMRPIQMLPSLTTHTRTHLIFFPPFALHSPPCPFYSSIAGSLSIHAREGVIRSFDDWLINAPDVYLEFVLSDGDSIHSKEVSNSRTPKWDQVISFARNDLSPGEVTINVLERDWNALTDTWLEPELVRVHNTVPVHEKLTHTHTHTLRAMPNGTHTHLVLPLHLSTSPPLYLPTFLPSSLPSFPPPLLLSFPVAPQIATETIEFGQPGCSAHTNIVQIEFGANDYVLFDATYTPRTRLNGQPHTLLSLGAGSWGKRPKHC